MTTFFFFFFHFFNIYSYLLSLLGNRLPGANLGLESVISDKSAGSTGIIGLKLVRVGSDGELVLGGVTGSGIDSITQPKVPSGLHLRHVVVFFLVLDVSGSQMDFVLVVGFVELVSVDLR